ncbi:MAG: outer membrane lipoprotein carrier protein LolA [Gammaproteobacteria bacterium]|nr:MAG: outer membrane lipoprotein carrier protein LolA [Gammaproteobacteria bacterium]
MKMRKVPITPFFCLLLLLNWASHSFAGSQEKAFETLQAKMQKIHSYHARFVQKQWSGADSTSDPDDVQEGQFFFSRPDRFHWIYSKPFHQEYIADGTTLKIYDEDLEQGIIRSQKDYPGFMFSYLFMPDDPVWKEYDIEMETQQHGKTLFILTPNKSLQQPPVQKIRIEFNQSTITMIDILDAFDQRTLIQFTQSTLNPVVPDSAFVMQWPEGLEVLDERHDSLHP